MGLLWKRCHVKGTTQAYRGEFRRLRGVVAGSFGFLSRCVSTWGSHSCLLREVRCPFALQLTPQDSSRITAGMSSALSLIEGGTSGLLSILTSIVGSLWIWNRGVRPRLVSRYRTPLASRVVHRVSGDLSSCIWDLWLFWEDPTNELVPLCVVTSSSGLHLKRCLGIRTYLEWTGKSLSFGMWQDPQGFLSSFNVRPASS